VEGCLGQPNEATTVYKVELLARKEFRDLYKTPAPEWLTLKEAVEGCRDRSGQTSHARIARLAEMSERLRALDHPHLARTYGYWTDGPRHYVLRDYVEGKTLESMLAAGDRPGQGVDARDLVFLGRALADAAAYLHENGLVHRDLSPSNVIICEEPGERRGRGSAKPGLYPVVVDLESSLPLSQVAEDPATFTPRYAPPELYRRFANLPRDARIDQYYLGALLHCAAWGVQPRTRLPNGLEAFLEAPARMDALAQGRPDPQLGVRFFRRDLPKGLCDAIDRLRSPDPDDRFATDAQVLKALTRQRQMPTVKLPSRAVAVLVTAALGFLVGWTYLRPGWQSQAAARYRQAGVWARQGQVSVAQEAREQAQAILEQHRGQSLPDAVTRARVDYGLACQEAGWDALRRGDYQRAYALSQEALRSLGRANTASARDLYLRSKAMAGQ
jgi:hypothetical protein